MTDNAEEITTINANAPAPPEEEVEHPKPPTMAATTDEQQQLAATDHTARLTEKMSGLSFSIWPPTQRTRDAVATRLLETLSTPTSVLSKRYGALPHDEADAAARRIEAEAFAAASASAAAVEGGGDGIEVLQAYSKEISRRMLDAVKSRSVAAPVPVPVPVPDTAPASGGEEIEAGEKEA